jgi:hypothetical protein
MTTLPNEIINKIFSYIEGNHNQIIKNGLTNTFWTNRDVSTFDMKFAFYMIRCNLLRDKKMSNHKAIKYNKYFKYSVLHEKREYLFDYIKYDLRELVDEFNYDDYYYNYNKILRHLREKYIYEHNYTYNLTNIINVTNRLLRKGYSTYYKYTILHNNRKVVFNEIKRYNTTKKGDICNKKLSNNILLERGILINYKQTNNNKRQKKWN